MTEEEKQNKKFAFQIACLLKASAYCEVCPVSKGCNLDFIRDDTECYVRFFNWFDGTNVVCKEIRRINK